MRYLLLIFFLYGIIGFSTAQNSVYTHLEKELMELDEDTVKLKRLSEIAVATPPDSNLLACGQLILKIIGKVENEMYTGYEIEAYNYIGMFYGVNGMMDKSYDYFTRALTMARKKGELEGLTLSLNNLGMWYNVQGEISKAEKIWLRTISIKEKTMSMNGIAVVCNSLALVYKDLGKVDKSFHYLYKALDYSKLEKDSAAMANAYNTLGVLFFDQKQYEKSIEHQQRALEIQSRIGDEIGIAYSELNIGQSHMLMGNIDLALELNLKALSSLEQIGDQFGLSSAYSNCGKIYNRKKEWTTAKDYFKKALTVSNEAQLQGQVAETYCSLAETENKLGNIDQAFWYAKEALKIAKKEGLLESLERSSLVLASLYKGRGNYIEAFNYLNIYQETKDSLRREQNAKLLSDLNLRLQQEKHEAKLKLTNAELEREKLNAQRQQLIRNVVILIALLVLWMAFLVVRSIVIRRKHQQELHIQELRTKIASDLHDDVGSMLTEISLKSQLLEVGQFKDGELKKELTSLSETGREAVSMMSDVVWSVDQRNSSVQDLVDRIQDVMMRLLDAKEIQHTVEVDKGLGSLELEPLVKKNVYLVCKEAITNVAKHSNATSVFFKIRKVNDSVKIEIIDNGGFTENTGPKGQGLLNMRMRAEQIGASINIFSESGYSIELTVPN